MDLLLYKTDDINDCGICFEDTSLFLNCCKQPLCKNVV